MGCDMHLWIEKRGPGGIWERVDVPEKLMPDDRNYELFGYLAGVRYRPDRGSWFEDRGVPYDSSVKGTEYESLHSMTFAYLWEILAAPWEEIGLGGTYFCVFFRYSLCRLLDNGRIDSYSNDDKSNIRVIMGFDC